MRLRSLLFVPGDRPDRMTKALSVGADALILDLEDSVAPASKPDARQAVASFLASGHDATIFVRINPFDSCLVEEDLAAILPSCPRGIMLPKASGGGDVTTLAGMLPAQTLILPITAETPDAIFTLGTFAGSGDALCGLTWGAEDLATSVGAVRSREKDGSFAAPYQLARSLTLFAAHSAGVAAIDTVYANFRDLDGLATYAAKGYRDGFHGMMAIHPSQVPVINAAFTPSDAEVEHAHAVIEAFAREPAAGALSLNGKMIDAPHLKAAQRILALK